MENDKNINGTQYEKKPKPSEIRKTELKELLSHHDMDDLRFSYYKAPRGYYVTAVTKRIRNGNYLVAAFSFCSPKDSFCKAEGKVNCLRRIRDFEKLMAESKESEPNPCDVDISYIAILPFANVPTILNIIFAYNLIESKPLRLENTKFTFELYDDAEIVDDNYEEKKCSCGCCTCKSQKPSVIEQAMADGILDADADVPVDDTSTMSDVMAEGIEKIKNHKCVGVSASTSLNPCAPIVHDVPDDN